MCMVLSARVSLHILFNLWNSVQWTNKRLSKYILQMKTVIVYRISKTGKPIKTS